MPKHIARRHKVAVHPAPAARPTRHPKVTRGHKVAVKVAKSPAVAMAPEPRIIEVVDLEFPDPDALPYEEAYVTEFEDEDF